MQKKFYHRKGFQEKRHFRQKLTKIQENIDHNIDPPFIKSTSEVHRVPGGPPEGGGVEAIRLQGPVEGVDHAEAPGGRGGCQEPR
jgi:hypothetical protein